MGQGSPVVNIKEYDLSDVVPSFKGVVGAIVIDAAKGEVNRPLLVTSEKEFIDTFGKPLPKKFGLGAYSAVNFLKSSDKLYVVRVDKGQLFSSALVRAKIDPISELDEYGFVSQTPYVDPIVKPLGALSQHDIDTFNFVQYPRTRVTSVFTPELHLADRPYNGDTTLILDNVAPIEIGQKITLKDTTGLSREVTLGYKTYTVTAKEHALVRQEYLVLDTELQPFPFDEPVRAITKSYSPYGPALTLFEDAAAGTATLRTLQTAQILANQVIKITGHSTLYTVQSAVDEAVYAATATAITVSGLSGASAVTAVGNTTQLANGDLIKIGAVANTITSVVGQTINLGTPLGADVTAGVVTKSFNTTKVTLAANLDVTLPAGTSLTKEVTSVTLYNPLVVAKEIVPGFPNKIRVANHDPVAEGDKVSINGVQYTVTAKETLENYVNRVTLDQEYQSQTPDLPGNSVFDVVFDDFEYRDAFMVYEKSPGEWGNKVAIAIRDSKNYEEAFNIDVYYDADLVETWEVTRQEMLDGFGQQMFMEMKINTASRYIKVKNNPFMVGDDGISLPEPLKTLYYIRQPVAKPIYTKVADIMETVWDTDNLIRVTPESIYDLNVSRQVQIAGKLYDISQVQSSIPEGPIDTIVLQQAISLGLDALPANERYLPVGTDVNQQLAKNQEEKFTIPSITPSTLYSVTIQGTQYSVNSASNTASVVFGALAAAITADTTTPVFANVTTVLGVPQLNVRALAAGVPFTVAYSSGLVKTTVHANAREWNTYHIERVNGSIMPANTIGSVVALPGDSYTIWDAGSNRLSGGWDGNFPTIGQYLIAVDDCLANPEDVDYLALMDGAVTYKAYQQRLVEIAKTRKDCIALLSVSYAAQANPDILSGVVQYRQDLLLNESFAGLYAPWVKVYDKWNDFEIWVSPESFAARAISYIAAERELWYAPAGWNYGRIIALDLGARYTKGQRDVLYDNQINPIRFDPKRGLAIWGQKTLQVKPSALDRMNVRLLLIVIERALKEFLENKIFELNDVSTRRRIKLEVEGFLNDIKVRGGLYDFMVVCDDTNNPSEIIDRNELFVDVYLKPVKVAEFLTGRVIITRTGANFAEVKI